MTATILIIRLNFLDRVMTIQEVEILSMILKDQSSSQKLKKAMDLSFQAHHKKLIFKTF